MFDSRTDMQKSCTKIFTSMPRNKYHLTSIAQPIHIVSTLFNRNLHIFHQISINR